MKNCGKGVKVDICLDIVRGRETEQAETRLRPFVTVKEGPSNDIVKVVERDEERRKK